MSDPIPLTVLEKFLFWEDRPEYPWCAFCKFEFEGQIDRDAFTQAANEALQRHVLLRSVVSKYRGQLNWVPVENVSAPIKWFEKQGTRVFPPLKHIDLTQQIGLQLGAVCSGTKTDLIFGGHHACADALGGASYARDVFIIYSNLIHQAAKRIELPRLNHEELKVRGRFGMGFRKFMRQLPMQLVGLAGARQFVSRKPAALIPHQASNDVGLASGYPHVLTGDLDRAATKEIRESCKRNNVTLNDRLTRDLFLAINDWRQERDQNADDWIRMMIPMNVRNHNSHNLPATNYVSSVFLDRKGTDFDDPESLLGGIRKEMQLIKDNNLGMTFLFSLKLLNLLPGRLKRAATEDRCTCSCIFSNLDRHFLRLPFPREDGKLRIGNLLLKKAWTIAPLRPYSLASFMSLVYDGRLLLTLHFDRRYIDKDAAGELLSMWQLRLKTSGK